MVTQNDSSGGGSDGVRDGNSDSSSNDDRIARRRSVSDS